MENKTDKFNLDKILKSFSKEEIIVPSGLSETTIKRIAENPVDSQKVFPYVLVVVFVINLLISLFFGGILFLLRPITMIEWIIIGSVYSSVNVLLYGITFLNYSKIQNLLSSYSAGGM